MDFINDNIIFGLDIGTRSIVGIVGYFDRSNFKVLASHVELHETRSMIDGQIHDIEKVASTITKTKLALEKKTNKKLKKVCIAAAGRVLKTLNTSVEVEIEDHIEINKEMIQSLELQGMERAMHQVNYNNSADDMPFYCVGYSVTNYYLNDFVMKNLEGHKGSKIGADILSTFLPTEVVNSLYKVIDMAHLEVYSLTLEPIAAIEVAIPINYRLLNIALVDIGAGTSDIAITKGGSIVAYGMIPFAGDELTESIVHEYLVDFKTAEKIKIKASGKAKTVSFKDAIGMKQTVELDHVRRTMEGSKLELAKKIAGKIIELNGNHKTNAVFIVGGGGQINDFEPLLAKEMELNRDRVALRGKDVLSTVMSEDKNFKKKPEFVTPIGICMTGLNNNQHDFVEVFLNDESIRIFNTNRLTVMDVVALKGMDPKSFIGKYGRSLSFVLNGVDKRIRGSMGQAAKIYVNQKEADLSTAIKMHDYINIIPAIDGQAPHVTVKDVIGDNHIFVNNEKKLLPIRVMINLQEKSWLTIIDEGDDVSIVYPNLFDFLTELGLEFNHIFVNEEPYLNQAYNCGDHVTTFLLEESDVKDNQIEDLHDQTNTIIPSSENLVSTALDEDQAITLKVNDQELRLEGKREYRFVDIFDYIDFDRSKPRGTLFTSINDEKCSYMDPIKDGDVIKIYWNETSKR